MTKTEEIGLTTDLYAEMKKRLVERGIPADEIAFIHDAKTPAARKRLFEAVSAGKVRVLVGSTEKMGTGMNAQERLIAVHHFTPPWRPADITQQIGRAHRQGNRYPKVYQFIHAAMRSFEPYMWQTLENKATFIEQLDARRIGAREVTDISETALTFSEVKALATGDSRMAERIALEMKVSRLRTLRTSFARNQARLQMRYNDWKRIEQIHVRRINALEAVVKKRLDEGPFQIRLRKSLRDADLIVFGPKQKDAAGKQIMRLLAEVSRKERDTPVGDFHGLPLYATHELQLQRGAEQPIFVPILYLEAGQETRLINGSTPRGYVTSLQRTLRGLPKRLEELRKGLDNAIVQQAELEKELARPWEHDKELQNAKNQLAALRKAMDGDGEDALEEARKRDSDEFARAARRLAEALDEIRAMHADPAVLARFDVITAPVAVSDASGVVDDLAQEVAKKQAELAELEFRLTANTGQKPPAGKAVQLDLFGGFAEVCSTSRRRRRRR